MAMHFAFSVMKNLECYDEANTVRAVESRLSEFLHKVVDSFRIRIICTTDNHSSKVNASRICLLIATAFS